MKRIFIIMFLFLFLCIKFEHKTILDSEQNDRHVDVVLIKRKTMLTIKFIFTMAIAVAF